MTWCCSHGLEILESSLSPLLPNSTLPLNPTPQACKVGANVVDCEPILGYLHKGMEKIVENRTIIRYLPYVTLLGIC
jgi:hypothetical protein